MHSFNEFLEISATFVTILFLLFLFIHLENKDDERMKKLDREYDKEELNRYKDQ